MEKRRRASKSSKLDGVPSKTYVFDGKTSRFLESFQEMFHRSNDGVPFLVRRDSLGTGQESHDEQNQARVQERVRLLSEEMSTARKNSEMFHISSQYQTHEANSRAMSYVDEKYGFPSLPTIRYLRGRGSNLFPLSEYTPSTDYSSPTKSEDPDLKPTEYGDIYKREFASSQNVTEQGSKIKRSSEKRHEFESDKPEEKARKDQSIEYSDPRNGADERQSYWERRRRNNASAKKSRDARRARELQTKIMVAFLEKENMRMLAELMAVRQENVCLRRLVLGPKM